MNEIILIILATILGGFLGLSIIGEFGKLLQYISIFIMGTIAGMILISSM